MPPLPSSAKLVAATVGDHACGTNPSSPEPRLILKGQLEDLARVWPWVEALATRYSVPADTQFAIQLCLEEALSNIVRHGYGGQPNQSHRHRVRPGCRGTRLHR